MKASHESCARKTKNAPAQRKDFIENHGMQRILGYMTCIGEQCSTKGNEVALVLPQPRHYRGFKIEISSLLKALLTFYDSVTRIRFLPDFQVSPQVWEEHSELYTLNQQSQYFGFGYPIKRILP